MKANKGFLIAMAAGTAIAGLAGFLFATKNGKEITRKGRVADKLDDVLCCANNRKQPQTNEDFVRENELEDVTEAYQ